MRCGVHRRELATGKENAAVERERHHLGVGRRLPGRVDHAGCGVHRRQPRVVLPSNLRERPAQIDGRAVDRNRLHDAVGVGIPRQQRPGGNVDRGSVVSDHLTRTGSRPRRPHRRELPTDVGSVPQDLHRCHSTVGLPARGDVRLHDGGRGGGHSSHRHHNNPKRNTPPDPPELRHRRLPFVTRSAAKSNCAVGSRQP